jgi:hypothetical protein
MMDRVRDWAPVSKWPKPLVWLLLVIAVAAIYWEAKHGHVGRWPI